MIIEEIPYKHVPDFPDGEITMIEREHIRAERHELIQYNERVRQRRNEIRAIVETMSYETICAWIKKHNRRYHNKIQVVKPYDITTFISSCFHSILACCTKKFKQT
jgi:hypothetical protein